MLQNLIGQFNYELGHHSGRYLTRILVHRLQTKKFESIFEFFILLRLRVVLVSGLGAPVAAHTSSLVCSHRDGYWQRNHGILVVQQCSVSGFPKNNDSSFHVSLSGVSCLHDTCGLVRRALTLMAGCHCWSV